jgi:hypothetical protein
MSFRYLTAESELPFIGSEIGLKKPHWMTRTVLNDDQDHLDSRRRSDQSKIPRAHSLDTSLSGLQIEKVAVLVPRSITS